MNIQPVLENEKAILYPLQEADFEALYAIGSDPKIWEQHPDSNRWEKEIFQAFFDLAMKSKGAFKIVAKTTGDTIGSTRFYDYDEQGESICIGFTFYPVAYWGTGVNLLVKNTMLAYAFQFVSKVYFHIGAHNLRSQFATERVGANKVEEQTVTYRDGTSRLDFLYVIHKEEWRKEIG